MKLRIATWNISGGVSKKVEGDTYFDQDRSKQIDETFLNEIIKIINNKNLDVVCFQEIITTEDTKYIKRIVDNTELKYSSVFELSECNLVENTNCGIAILSKYPIKKTDTMMFTNPKLAKQTKTGNTYYTYDKGCMNCAININERQINIITHHGFPFRRFNSTPEKNLNIYSEFNDFISKYKNRIVTGDFNAENPLQLIPVLNNMYEVEDEITTIDNMRFDKIYLDKDFKLINYNKTHLISDHFLLVVEISV